MNAPFPKPHSFESKLAESHPVGAMGCDARVLAGRQAFREGGDEAVERMRTTAVAPFGSARGSV